MQRILGTRNCVTLSQYRRANYDVTGQQYSLIAKKRNVRNSFKLCQHTDHKSKNDLS